MNEHSFKTIANPLGRATSCHQKGVAVTRMAHVGSLIFILHFALAMSATAQNILARVSVPSNDCCQVAVNVALNKIYVSGGYSGGQDVFVVDGKTFKGSDIGNGSTVSD
jgi:hypothetical protein